MIRLLLLLALVFNFAPAFADDAKKTPPKRKIASANDEQVKAKFKSMADSMPCNEELPLDIEKIVHAFRYDYQSDKEPMNEAVFYIGSCMAGAYNTASAVLFDNPYSGLEFVYFATPVIGAKNKILGWNSELVTGGLSYDAKTKTLSSFSKGRGIGDMSTTITYALYHNSIILRKFSYDGTGDGKFNQKVLWESKEPLK